MHTGKPDDSTLIERTKAPSSAHFESNDSLSLVLTWSHDEPERVGEVVVVPSGRSTLGRAVEPRHNGWHSLVLSQTRPQGQVETGPLRSAHISRYQLTFDATPKGTSVELTGRGCLRVNGQEVTLAQLSPGDRVQVAGKFSLLVSTRPRLWLKEHVTKRPFAYGLADPHGLVGESPAAWLLRRECEYLGQHDDHILVCGPSGVGKELAVRAIHAHSPKQGKELVARNAATIPESLIDAELFGNLRDYPNPGSPDRPGLLGMAHGTTLFLDEIGELPQQMQAHLLRVMDSGEYQRLGDARRSYTSARIIAATNRNLECLKHDFVARFIHRVEVPGLAQRLEDIPLIARHLAREIAKRDPEVRRKFFNGDEPRFSEALINMLLTIPYRTNVRELARVLWQAVRQGEGPRIQAPSILALHTKAVPSLPEAVDRTTGLSRARVLDVLNAVGWVREQAWRELGLANRYQLRRLLARLSIDPSSDTPTS
ncbi:MAG: sigma-54-dependent transcriptional regulator [Nannocystaceae bacterium]